MQLQKITITIQVTDLQKAIEFYQKLGFSQDWLWPESDPTHASVSNGGQSFMMVKKSGSVTLQKADLYFWVKGVKELHHDLKAKGFNLPDLQLTDYGMLDFSLEDPWGHFLTFGEPSGPYTPS